MSEATSGSPGGERWLPVVGYEGMYEVSDQGRVRSLDRVDAAGRVRRGRILSPSMGRCARVRLSANGQSVDRSVHRLVLTAHVGGPPSADHVAMHLDDDTWNNSLSNLSWGTGSENVQQSISRSRHWQSRKSSCPEGHPLVDGNIRESIRRPGHRACLACGRARATLKNHPEASWSLGQVADAYVQHQRSGGGRIRFTELMERYG